MSTGGISGLVNGRPKGRGMNPFQDSIKQKIEILKANPEYGIHIPKDRIPKEYVRDYDVNNLWKVNLSGAWRMIYTIRGSEVEIISLILDIMNHRDYKKKFGYNKS